MRVSSQVQPIATPLTAAGAGGGGGFDPASLFASGEKGIWLSPSDFSTMFQDSGMTVPVTAAGQPVVKMLDKSGNGNTVTFSNVTLEFDGDKYYLAANGSTSSGQTAAIDFTGTAQMSYWFRAQLNNTAPGVIVELSANAGTRVGAFYIVTRSAANGDLEFGLRGTSATARRTPGATIPVTVYASNILDLSQSDVFTEVNPRVNGDAPALTNGGTASAGAGNFGNHVLNFFARNASSLRFNGRLYEFILRGASSTPQERINGESWVQGLSPSNYPYILEPTSFSDSQQVVKRDGYLETSCYARTVFSTSAENLTLHCKTNIYSTSPGFAAVGVWVNGAYNQTVDMGATGNVAIPISLPAGLKTVEVVNGTQSRPNPANPVNGSFFVWATSDEAPMTQAFPTPSNRIIFYGDSITAGDAAVVEQRDCYAMLVRDAYIPDSTAIEAWGYRSLHEDCVDSSARAAFVAKIAAYSPARLWMAVGTNDYGLNKWNAASFGAAYAATLDALNSAMPSLQIYCQTPIPRNGETANGSGSTLGDYRAEIASAVSTRSSFCTLVDGTAIVTTSDLADGVHPTTAGHAIYAAYVKGVLGL